MSPLVLTQCVPVDNMAYSNTACLTAMLLPVVSTAINGGRKQPAIAERSAHELSAACHAEH